MDVAGPVLQKLELHRRRDDVTAVHGDIDRLRTASADDLELELRARGPSEHRFAHDHVDLARVLAVDGLEQISGLESRGFGRRARQHRNHLNVVTLRHLDTDIRLRLCFGRRERLVLFGGEVTAIGVERIQHAADGAVHDFVHLRLLDVEVHHVGHHVLEHGEVTVGAIPCQGAAEETSKDRIENKGDREA